MLNTLLTPQLFTIIAGFFAGGAIGSFIGCAAYRVPRGISMITPRSHCPACQHQLTARELVPVFSYLWQKGHARCCGVRLTPVYFWAELLCAAAGGIAAYAVIA